MAHPKTPDEFAQRLKKHADGSRFAKSLKMLKKDGFQLFSKVDEEQVVGVVRSQTDHTLIYGCRLGSDGSFACCTQNLNHCGGLRGQPCKHILLLLMGLAHAEVLNTEVVWPWVLKSKRQAPELDKESMADVFLMHAQPEALDWRPTETLPEDFLAY